MIKKPDIVSLKWVMGLINKQADNAEAALVEYGNNPQKKQAILRCMWAVHQITSTLRTLGMRKAEMLTIEMERSLNHLYKDKVAADRRKLVMGGLMQALKVIPAYLDHTQSARLDTGRGLEKYVNDLRRFLGERPRPKAFFFYMEIPDNAGISVDASPASDEEIRSRANVMLALYLGMAKQALRNRNVVDSMKNVARIARKMQTLFAGTEAERFWFTLIGLCEGIAGKLIVPDECIAQILKAGAFAIKFARENGGAIEENTDYDNYTQQMLFYIASCTSRPVHILNIREVLKINSDTLQDAAQPLVHSDALIIALSSALEHVNAVVEFVEKNDLATIAIRKPDDQDRSPLDAIEAAEYRLIAAGQMEHANALKKVQRQLKQFYGGVNPPAPASIADAVGSISQGLVAVKLDLEHKLRHGLNSSYAGTDFELRETVSNATFKQMGLVENYLHQILRRKALKNALDKKPQDGASILRLTTALQRHLNKTEEGFEELREAIRNADNGDADTDLLYRLGLQYQDQLNVMPDREAIDKSLQLLHEISDALIFANMQREGGVMERCHRWLSAASDAGSVHEDEPFRCFADAFAQIEMHLQRSLIDPLDDTSHMIIFAEQRAAELDQWTENLSPGRTLAEIPQTCQQLEAQEEALVQDAEMPEEFREVFVEESQEIVAHLQRLTETWLGEPTDSDVLGEIRRHFHTFKGNGRAVGANILGELGWAVQDMLDRTLDGDLFAGENVQRLVSDVVESLPNLVESYNQSEGLDVERIRELTSACFAMAWSSGAQDPSPAPDIGFEKPESISSSAGIADTPAVRKILTH